MRRNPYVFAVTQAELVNIYGNSRQLRELLERLERARDAQESIELLLKFEESDWIKWSLPQLSMAGNP